MNESQRPQMSLRAATRDVIKQVETITGRPVLVQADPSLSVLATVKMARGAAPAHLVRYKPGGNAPDCRFTVFRRRFSRCTIVSVRIQNVGG
jgi:hypothetical protein